METATAPTGRTLNMQEKRKLEKLLLADIDEALATYAREREATRKVLIEEALTKPPHKAQLLLAKRMFFSSMMMFSCVDC